MLAGAAVVLLLVVVYGVPSGIVSGQESSCDGRCGPGTDGSQPCQCNAFCQDYDDCCHDYLYYCEATCSGQCGSGLDTDRPCQCNSHCVTHGDCCADYQDLCVGGGGNAGNCPALTDVTEYFWNNDVNRMTSSEYTVDWQAQVSAGNTVDQSSRSLISSLDESAFYAKPTFAAFVALLNNYDSIIGSGDFLSSEERAEIDRLYSVINATTIFHKLFEFLLCEGHVASQSDFQTKFYNLWFDLYGRSSSSSAILDSSGFEHVMVGELRVSGGSQSISGFHNWIQFYEEEKLGRVNYYGFVRRVQVDGVPHVIGANFAWRPPTSSRDVIKPMTSFFLGSSPEFDLAVYTLCAFQSPNAVCDVQLGGASVRIQTWDISHKSGLQGTAFSNTVRETAVSFTRTDSDTLRTFGFNANKRKFGPRISMESTCPMCADDYLFFYI